MTPIVFLDTECTGMDLDADIWELGALRREPDGRRSELHLFLSHDVRKAMRLREPFHSDYVARLPDDTQLVPARQAAVMLTRFIGYDAVVVGAVSSYDCQRLAVLFARYRMAVPPWLYTMVDVYALAAGYLQARGEAVDYPVRVDQVSRGLGVDADHYSRHTAMGDVMFVEEIFDACMDHTPAGAAQSAFYSGGVPNNLQTTG